MITELTRARADVFASCCTMLQVLRGEEIPADLVFLSAMNDDPELRGMCHVQTAQLDGETNLKLRQSTPRVMATFCTDDDCKRFHGYVECEQPTEHFGKFTGKMLFSEEDAVRLCCRSLLCMACWCARLRVIWVSHV